MSSSWPCKFFNTESGCKNQTETCSHRHELFCTNKLCIDAKKHHTHTLVGCGRKGGGSHTNYIAKKKAQAIEKKPMLAPVAAAAEFVPFDLEAATIATCEKLFVKVKEVLDTSEGVAEKEFGVTPTPGKIVGMFKQGLPLKELNELLTNPNILNMRMAEAIELIANFSKTS